MALQPSRQEADTAARTSPWRSVAAVVFLVHEVEVRTWAPREKLGASWHAEPGSRDHYCSRAWVCPATDLPS